MDNATDILFEHGVCDTITHINNGMIHPGKRTGDEEIIFIVWMYCKENTERFLCIRLNSRGGLVENCISYRVLNQSYGYDKYIKDVESEEHPFYSRSHFYKQNNELNSVHNKEDDVICPNCTILGNETWNKLPTEIRFLYSVANEKQQLNLMLIDDFQVYFKC